MRCLYWAHRKLVTRMFLGKGGRLNSAALSTVRFALDAQDSLRQWLWDKGWGR